MNSKLLYKQNIINNFCNIYNIDKQELISNDSYYFRYICYKYNDFMKYITLPSFPSKSINEAVLIEFRIFPHLEFLIRNSILKLGNKWSHTIICGNLNYEFMMQICESISPNINIIRVNIDNMSPSQYNKFLTSQSFWNMLYGEKILIYQEDSILFNNNIEDFMQFDFIGSPLPEYISDVYNNGGFSLRSKSIMMKILNSIKVKNTNFDSSTQEYMNKNKLTFPPENIYYCKNAQELGIGTIADYDSAALFSQETVYKSHSLGGHQFWLCNNNWKNSLKDCFNYNNYIYKSDLNLYLNYLNLNESYSKLSSNKNAFDVDLYFCNIVNILNMDNKLDVIKYIQLIALDGYIYHPKQIINIFPNVKIYTFLENIFIMYKLNIYLVNDFVNKFLYNNTFENLTNILIKNRFNNLDSNYSSLILLVFIGNEERGQELLEKIIEYKKIQIFNVAFCFNLNSNIASKMKNIIKDNFQHYAVYETKEFGTDITPTLLMYDDIVKSYQFTHIIKLQTKSIYHQFKDLTNYLLSTSLDILLLNKNKISNCIGNKEYYIPLSEDKFNNELKLRYIHDLHIKYSFVGGTIFYCPAIVFNKTLQFMKNNYKCYLFNNLYENNSINMHNSPIHFLERVFGVIKC